MIITKESNELQWQKLYRQWMNEGLPATLAAGDTHYRAYQDADTREMVFSPMAPVEMYGSSSLTGVAK